MFTAGLTSLGLLLCCLTGPSPVEDASLKKAQAFAAALRLGMRLIAEDHITAATEPQMIRWSVRGLYKAVNEPLPAELRRRLQRLERADGKEVLRLLNHARLRLGERKDLEEHNDLKLCFQAIFTRLEPGARPEDRSELVPPQDIVSMRAYPVGVGLQLVRDPATDMLRVETPLYQGPAYKAGIRAGDLITSIRLLTDERGRPIAMPPVFSTKGMSVERANQLLLGREGTRVVLSVLPATPGEQRKTP